MHLAKYLFLNAGFPPSVSNFESKNNLKSPNIISCFLDLFQTLPITDQVVH